MIFRSASFGIYHYTSKIFVTWEEFNYSKNNRNSNSKYKPSSLTYFLAGGITGFWIAFIETPIDLVKTKVQTQIFLQALDPQYKAKYNTEYAFYKYIKSKYGIKALWQGLSPTIVRNIPANALFFPGIEIIIISLT